MYLVGAGPGDPGLMTRRSLELIASADVVLYDRLIPPGALHGARSDAELRYVGKEPGQPAVAQEEINELLVSLGQAGRRVVRLKGGDPFVFGRGGEEAEALAEARVAFEVVPGVTAGVAAPAYAGIPVTHRDAASAVAFVTGHEDPSKDGSALDWEALARFPGTLVFYMGIKNLPLISERLVSAGRPASEPVAVVARGTLPGQRTVTGTLADIAAAVERASVKPPAITVVGAVTELRETLTWLEERPLHGEVVAVTRARAQASELASRLRLLGAEVVEAPAIRIEPLEVEAPPPADLLCLTSPNGVHLYFQALADDARSLAGTRIAAIGPGTAAALREHGIDADIVPERFVAEGLLEALADEPVEGKRVLIARAEEARDTLPDGLRERGALVEVVSLYRTLAEPLTEAAREALAAASYVTFTSSSTVRYLLEALGSGPAALASARLASIGPVTSATLREHGLDPHVEAERHDIDGLVDALTADVAARRVGTP
ncbi:MAG: uroporphyrinogen methyltransferase / synthase [Thermoleophilaceae bacterium]|nr:uroporphyrinogen methyltransferase / synthase [Thermoleophilaceae bacterium]